MRVFHSLSEVPIGKGSVVAIGNFDGCHLGHVSLLTELATAAEKLSLPATVLTFYPHPVVVLNPKVKLERLTTTAEKLAQLEALGIDQVLVEPFDAELAKLTAEEFFSRYLQGGLSAKSVHVGFNFFFGRDRKGDTDTLRSLCEKTGISLTVSNAVDVGGERVSSSVIRKYVREGEVQKAAGLLGRPYSVSGPVEHGDGRGKQLGFPTANVHFPSDKVFPKNGVYLTETIWQKDRFGSITNVGTKPTVSQSGKVSVETHILDLNLPLYEETVSVGFLERVRDEVRFESIEALKDQIAKDVNYAKSRLDESVSQKTRNPV